jgi:Domain of unknown function (DUF4783)
MKVIFRNILPLTFIMCFALFAQNTTFHNKSSELKNQKLMNLGEQDTNTSVHNNKVVNVIRKIESAIANNDIESLSDHLGSQTYLNLPNGISGYYSANQAYFVLEDFLKTYRVTSFSFDEINTKSNTPFATGSYEYDLKGNRDTARIYLQLRNTGKGWKINQITIN